MGDDGDGLLHHLVAGVPRAVRAGAGDAGASLGRRRADAGQQAQPATKNLDDTPNDPYLALVGAMSWASFVILLVPLVVLPEAVLYGLRPHERATLPVSRTLRVFGLVAAAAFIGILTLSPSVWLPLRQITFIGDPPALKNGPLPQKVAAYVLSSDDKGSSLLLEEPRAVVDVTKAQIERDQPLCVPPESRLRVLTTRASQVLGIDIDPHSPYQTCPQIEQRLLGGG